jgi:abhydrolase domain-containing protein 17
LKARHKRSDTKILSILSGRNSSSDENTQTNINTVRTALPDPDKQLPQSSQNIRLHLPKNRGKFQSDSLYRQDEHEEFEDGDKIQSVRLFSRLHNKFSLEANRTSRLWSYQSSSLPAIPCLYFQSSHYGDRLMLYFHGNGEDLAGCHGFLRHLSAYTQVSVLAVEYPGYSFYEGTPSSEGIESDGREVLEFLRDQLGFETQNIMVVGRSIGSGPALHVASLYDVGGLVLLSPFLSLCEAVGDLYGAIASGLLKQRFDNKERAKEVQSPCLIVHGTKDRLISQKHATELSQYFRGFCTIKIVKEMTHSVFSHEDFFAFVSDFQIATDFID